MPAGGLGDDSGRGLRQKDVGIEALLEGTEIVRRAEWQLGLMLPTVTGGSGRKEKLHDATFLSDLGIEKTQSSRFQRIASLSEEQFEAWIASCREAKVEIEQVTRWYLAISALCGCNPAASNAHGQVLEVAGKTRGRPKI